jgi:hypothetical protein
VRQSVQTLRLAAEFFLPDPFFGRIELLDLGERLSSVLRGSRRQGRRLANNLVCSKPSSAAMRWPISLSGSPTILVRRKNAIAPR